MPTEVPQIGFGSIISHCTTSGGTYVALAKVLGIKVPEVDVADVPIECFDNPTFNGLPVSDFIPGWTNAGECEIKMEFTKTQFGTLRGLAGVAHFYKIIKSDTSGYVFPGYIKKIMDEVPLKETMTATIVVKVTGGVAPFSAVQA